MTDKPDNAVTLLVADHKKAAGLFNKFEDTTAHCEQLAARKNELLAMAKAGTLPAPQPVTINA